MEEDKTSWNGILLTNEEIAAIEKRVGDLRVTKELISISAIIEIKPTEDT